MIIYLDKIYSDLECWRTENKITAESQRDGYLVNVMEKFGELSQALRSLEFKKTNKTAECEIIEALCNIGILTISAGADILLRKKETEIDTSEIRHILFNVNSLISDCANYDRSGCTNHLYYNYVLKDCASLCENWGYNFEIAMLETIKEISSRTGTYDENAKKWEKDLSDEAQAKWYKADYEKARLYNLGK